MLEKGAVSFPSPAPVTCPPSASANGCTLFDAGASWVSHEICIRQTRTRHTLDRAQGALLPPDQGPGAISRSQRRSSVTRCDQGTGKRPAPPPMTAGRWSPPLGGADGGGGAGVSLHSNFADDAPPPACESGGPSVRGDGEDPGDRLLPEGGTAWSPASSRGRGGAPLQQRGTRPFSAPCVWIYYGRTGDAGFVRRAWPAWTHYRRLRRGGPATAISMEPDGSSPRGGAGQVTWMDVCAEGHLPPATAAR